jgi:hypothetical protein
MSVTAGPAGFFKKILPRQDEKGNPPWRGTVGSPTVSHGAGETPGIQIRPGEGSKGLPTMVQGRLGWGVLGFAVFGRSRDRSARL